MEDPYLLEEILNDDKINEGNLDMMNIDKNLDDILNETTYTNTINLDDTNNNFTNNNNSNINNNIIINNNNYNIEKKQFFKSPLDFISQYEKNNYSPIPLPLNYLPLKSHSHSNFNPKTLEFLPKYTLSSQIYYNNDDSNSINNNNIITCMAVEGDNLFIGNFFGVIFYYSISKERLIQKLTKDEIFMTKKKDRVVNCLLLQGSFLFGGFKNGYITVWDVSDKKNIYCRFFVDKHERKEIMAIGFVNWENNYLEFISSDLEGNVYLVNVWEGYLYSTVESEKIYINENENENENENDINNNINKNNNDEIFFIITRINISSTDIKKHNLKSTFFYAFCSLLNIYIYQIKPNIVKIFRFKKPFYILSENIFPIPDFSSGFSFIPRKYNDLLDYNKDYKVLNMFYNYTVFAISWEKIITIYAIEFENKDFMQIVPIANFENECAIVRCGFVSNSVVFIVDIKNNIKILNIVYMEPGKYNNYNDNKNNNIIIEKFCIDEGILFQMILPEDKNKMINKMTFNNVIMYANKKLFILGKKNFYYGMIVGWEQFLNKIQNEGKWLDVLKIGLDIFNGKFKMLCDIPVDEETRKYKIGFAIKGIIFQYILIKINKNNNNNNVIKDIIKISIEFCIEVNDIDYLFNQIFPIIKMKGYEIIFYETLEPFIYNNMIKDVKMDKLTAIKIITLIIKKNNPDNLNKLLLHFNINTIDIEEIKNICIKYNLINPLIYLNMNGKEKDYFYCVEKIYYLFVNNTNNIFIDYNKNNNNIINIDNNNNLDNSKQYLGHKLFWYLNLCLDGINYPFGNKIEKKKHSDVVLKIFYWIFQNNNIKTLINFDYISLFNIFLKFFYDENILNIIKNGIEYNEKIFENIITENERKIENSDLNNFIDVIIYNTILLKDQKKSFALCELIIKIGINIENINNQVIIEHLNNFILFYPMIIENSDENNKNNEFYIIERNSKEYLLNISTAINKLIEKFFIDDEEELDNLLNQIEDTEFILVKIYLNFLLGEFIISFNLLLNDYDYYDKEEKIFEYANKIFEKIKKNINNNKNNSEENKNNKEILFSFKEEIKKYFLKLVSFSIPKTFALISNHFDNNHLLLINTIHTNKNLQLSYIEFYLSKINSFEISSKNECLEYYEILTTHILLLCQLNKKKSVILNLKKNPFYPIQECLDICIKYNEIDGIIFFYSKLEDYKSALNYSCIKLLEIFENFVYNLNEGILEKNKKNFEFGISQQIDKCINLCESVKNEIEQEIMFNQLIRVFTNFNKIIKDNLNKLSKENILYFKTLLNDNLKKLFSIIYPYLGMKKILNYNIQNFKNLERNDFKNIMIDMFEGINSYINILSISKDILLKNTLYKINNFSKLKKKGFLFQKTNCDVCNKSLKNEIVFFMCGHLIHLMCCWIDNEKDELVCTVCLKNEFENSIAFDIEEIFAKYSVISDNNIESNKNNINNNKKNNKNKNKKEIINDKLSKINDNYFNCRLNLKYI